jgi:hypothetical protein
MAAATVWPGAGLERFVGSRQIVEGAAATHHRP